METSPSPNDPEGRTNGENNDQTTSSSMRAATSTTPQYPLTSSPQPHPTSIPPLTVTHSPMTQPPTHITVSSTPGTESSTPVTTATPELPQVSHSHRSDASTSFQCPSFRCPSVQRPSCGSHRSCCRAIRRPSSDRFCFIVPSSLWLKFRLCAVFSLLLGMFLLIIFPLPDTIMFAISLILLIIAGTFIVTDVTRGVISNYWYENCVIAETTTERDISGRARTIEVTGNAGMDDYDNPAFSDEDSPPDYDTAITTPQPPVITTPPAHHRGPGTSHHRHRPPDITIDLTGIQGTSRDIASTPDILHTEYYAPSSMSSHTPTSMFSYEGSRSPPPSYEDVIKETNARRPIDQRNEVERTSNHQGDDQRGNSQWRDNERNDDQLIERQREHEPQNGDDQQTDEQRRDDQQRDDQRIDYERSDGQRTDEQPVEDGGEHEDVFSEETGPL